MGSGSEFNFAEFGEFLLELLASALWGLYMIFSYIFKEIAGVIGKYIIPVLPSRVRLLQDNNISAGILIAFVIYVLYMNIYTFNLFRVDKKKAKKAPPKDENLKRSRKYDRISERRLLMSCFYGGAFGGFLGMKICRHKTLKPKFRIGVFVMLVLQMLIFSFVVGFFGFWVYFT